MKRLKVVYLKWNEAKFYKNNILLSLIIKIVFKKIETKLTSLQQMEKHF